MMIGIDVIIATITTAMTDVTTTVMTTALISAIEVIVVMIATRIVMTTGATIDVARTTTTAKTTTARSEHLRHHPLRQQPQGANTSTTTQRGKPQWCIPEGQLRDQLHRRWSPSDQNQPANSIERQRDRARQH
jgi:hypothetical protein